MATGKALSSPFEARRSDDQEIAGGSHLRVTDHPNTAMVCLAAITGLPAAFQIVMFCPE